MDALISIVDGFLVTIGVVAVIDYIKKRERPWKPRKWEGKKES